MTNLELPTADFKSAPNERLDGAPFESVIPAEPVKPTPTEAHDQVGERYSGSRNNKLIPLSKAQAIRRLMMLPRNLQAGSMVMVASMLANDAKHRSGLNWREVYVEWAVSDDRCSRKQATRDIELVEKISEKGFDKGHFCLKSFDALTYWAQSGVAAAATQLPALGKDHCKVLFHLPQLLPVDTPAPMAMTSIEAARLKNTDIAEQAASAVLEGYKQDRLDRLHEYAEWLKKQYSSQRRFISRHKAKRKLRTSERFRKVMRRMRVYIRKLINKLVAQGWGYEPGTKQRQLFKRKVIVMNGAPGSAKSTTVRSLKATLNNIGDADAVKGDLMRRIERLAGEEGLPGLKVYGLKVMYQTSDTDKAREAKAEANKNLPPEQAERMFYRPGVNAPDPRAHPVDHDLPADGIVYTCWRNEERSAVANAGVPGDILCGAGENVCVFWGRCFKSRMAGMTEFREAKTIISAGMIGLDNPDAITPHKNWREHLQVIDDFTIGSFFDTSEYRLSDLSLPELPAELDALGNVVEPTERDKYLDSHLRAALSAVGTVIRSASREHRTREFVVNTADGGVAHLHELFDLRDVVEALKRYERMPAGCATDEGYAFKPEVAAALSRRKKALRLKRLLNVVLTPPPCGGDLDPYIWTRTRYSARITVGNKGPHKNRLVLKQVKKPGGNPTAPVLLLDGTVSVEVIREIYQHCEVIGGDAPRVEFGENVRVIQYAGKLYGMGTHSPVDDETRDAIQAAEANIKQVEQRVKAAGLDPYEGTSVSHQIRKMNKPVKNAREDRNVKDENARDALISAMAKAREVNAAGGRFVVVTYKQLTKYLKKAPKLPGCEFDALSMSKARGLNKFQGHTELWLIGRPGTPAAEALDIASALKGEALECEAPDRITGSRWVRGVGMTPAPSQAVLTDPLAQAIYDQLTLAELAQAIERLRLALRTDDVTVRIFTRTSIPYLPVDDVVMEDPLPHWGGDPHRLMLQVVPDATENLYDLYATIRGASVETTRNLFTRKDGGAVLSGARERLAELVELRDTVGLTYELGEGADRQVVEWSRWMVTMSQRTRERDPETNELLRAESTHVGWLQCVAGDVEGAKAVLTGLVGHDVRVLSVETVGDSPVSASRTSAIIKNILLMADVPTSPVSAPVVHPVGKGWQNMLAYWSCGETSGVVFEKAVQRLKDRLKNKPAYRAELEAAAASHPATHTVTNPAWRYTARAALSSEAAQTLRDAGFVVDEIAD